MSEHLPSKLAGLFIHCEALDIDAQEVLDDAVHTISEKIASQANPHCPDAEYDAYEAFMDIASLDASNINNQGYKAQIAYLEQHNAADGLREQFADIIRHGN